MGIFDKIKNSLFKIEETDEGAIKQNDIQLRELEFPLLVEKSRAIYNSIINYEYRFLSKYDIEKYLELYKKTNDESFLEQYNKHKYCLFIKPPIIRDLIACGRGYNLSKEEFYVKVKEIFNIIATDKDFSSDFCFDYIKNEIEQHYFYDPIKHVDFELLLKNLMFKVDDIRIVEGKQKLIDNQCPYCGGKQDVVLIRSKKCSVCKKKIYVSTTVFNEKMYLTENDYLELKKEVEEYKIKLNFCRMITSAGVKDEDLESYIQNGNLNKLNDFAWREQSKLRNNYYEIGQIDMLSRINMNLAKILMYEKKYKTAMVFICESFYADYSPIMYHPKFPVEKIGSEIKNKYENDTKMYNERNHAFINSEAIKLLKELNNHFDEEEFKNILRASIEKCTHYYLELEPVDIFDAIMKNI